MHLKDFYRIDESIFAKEKNYLSFQYLEAAYE